MTKSIGLIVLGSAFLWSLFWLPGFTSTSAEDTKAPPKSTKNPVNDKRTSAAPKHDEDLDYLRRKIRMLETRLIKQERKSSTANPSLQGDEEGTTSKKQTKHDVADSDDDERSRQHDQRVEEYYANLMAEDVPDTGGSVEAEEELDDFLHSLDLESSAVTTVECKEKLCKVVLEHADESGHRTLSESWGPGPFGEGSLQHLQEDGSTVVYAARRGQALPTLPSDTR